MRIRFEHDLETGRRRIEARRCTQPGCDRATRETKPFCTRHVRNHSYVQHLVQVLENQRAELARVRARGARAVNVDGLTAQEILSHLRDHGDRTLPRLARDLNLGVRLLSAYVRALHEEGLVSTRRNQRRVEVVALVTDQAEQEAQAAA